MLSHPREVAEFIEKAAKGRHVVTEALGRRTLMYGCQSQRSALWW